MIRARDDKTIDRLRSRQDEIRERFGVKSLCLFGSRAVGRHAPDSDLDLLVEFEEATTFHGYFDLKFYLEDLLDCDVDLITTRALRPELRRRIEGEVIGVA